MSTDNYPEISIIMGIYNCESTLNEAVASIKNQTVQNWELIMCDDGSSDRTYEIAENLQRADKRIVLLKNEHNLGLNITLNNCLKKARGAYIARMDGDDRCRFDRFEKELNILRLHPDISIVSSDMEFFDNTGIWGKISHPAEPKTKDFVRESPFCHAACMVRREAYNIVGGYTVANRLMRVEDYHLWIKMYAAGFRGKNIHEPLYQMRDDRNAYRRRSFRNRINESYVKCIAIRTFKLPFYNYIYALRESHKNVTVADEAVPEIAFNGTLEKGGDTSVLSMTDNTEVCWTTSNKNVVMLEQNTEENSISTNALTDSVIGNSVKAMVVGPGNATITAETATGIKHTQEVNNI